MHYPNCFFFSSRRRHTRCSRDWSSDVCSSDLNSLSQLLDLAVQGLLESASADRAGLWLASERRGETGCGRVVESIPGPIPEQWKHLDISTPFLRAALENLEPSRVEFGRDD